MFFFQDDIGILIQLASIPFPQILFEQQADRFLPIFRLFSLLEYRLFGLEFTHYVLVAFLIHFVNCILLGKISYKVIKNKFFALVAVAIFAVNITHVEPLLWWSAQGELLAMMFLELAFLLWYQFVTAGNLRHLYISIPLLLFSGFSYGVGIAAGIVFAVITYIYKNLQSLKRFWGIILYLLTGIISYLGGLLVAGQKPIPLQFVMFVVAGVSRGVVGRVFLPGFDPRHFEIAPTIISFIPLIAVLLGCIWLARKREKKITRLMSVLTVMIVYPYVWAGLLRFQFGLKQALAERYAYVSLFFFSILFSLLLSKLTHEGYIRSKRLLTIFIASILILQSFVFHLKAVDFEVRPQKTKKYFQELTEVVNTNDTIINLPLPSYVNQPYRISDLVSIISPDKKHQFVEPENFVCDNTTKDLFRNNSLFQFYLTQSSDWVVKDTIPKKNLYECYRYL